MNALIDWIDDRTGLPSMVDRQLGRPLAGGASWRYVLPGTLLFAFLVEVITGLVLWAFYCPGSQTAWESVYWFQEVVQAGWLVRGIHFFAGHAMVVLAGLYVAQLILTGMYRAPREFVFWAAVLMLLVLLGLLLTGDLLRGDQEGYWATRVRVGFLTLLPKIGGDAYKLVVGGSEFGHLTLTRFVVLHVGVLALVYASLLCWHNRMLARVGLAGRRATALADGLRTKPIDNPPQSYWPGQALRNLLAAVALSAVVGLLCVQNHGHGPHVGQRPGEYLGALPASPADPVDSYAAARPEWAFRPLYQMTALFKSSSIGNTGLSWQIVPIFGITSAVLLLVFLMPLVGKLSLGHPFNVALLLAIVAAAVGLGAMSVLNDRRDAKFQSALTLGEETARRAGSWSGRRWKRRSPPQRRRWLPRRKAFPSAVRWCCCTTIPRLRAERFPAALRKLPQSQRRRGPGNRERKAIGSQSVRFRQPALAGRTVGSAEGRRTGLLRQYGAPQRGDAGLRQGHLQQDGSGRKEAARNGHRRAVGRSGPAVSARPG